MKKCILSVVCILALFAVICLVIPAITTANQQTTPYLADDPETVLTAWESGNYSYIKLQTGMELALTGQTLTVDLAGNDLTVTGNGKLQVFDTENDTFDHTLCGVVTMEDAVTFDADYIAPNGNRYIAMGTANRATFHRLEMKLTSVALRMSCAGVYYKASFACDRLVEQQIGSYGVAVSTKGMPTNNFDAEDVLYTVNGREDFVNGGIVNSGIVADILNTDEGTDNGENLNTKIYARVYINVGNQKLMGDSYAATSLMDLMRLLDGQFTAMNETTKGQLDDFYGNWKNQGVSWSFEEIGKTKPDYNADLVFDAGTTNAYCPVCDKKVTWEALPESSVMQKAENGKHYYLASDLTFEGSGSSVYAYMQAPGSTDHIACVHLNNKKLTATKVPAFHGSKGVLNIMGNGVVTGTQDSSEKGKGAAIQTNNKIKTNAVNLYGGTYRKSDTSHANAGVIGIRAGGGGVFVYEGATIDATSGYAIYIGAPTVVDHRLGLYGCTVNGNVAFLEPANAAYRTKAELKDCTVNGTITLTEEMTMLLSGELDIEKLVVPQEARITTGGLKIGTVIGIDASGAFTQPSNSAAGYRSMFVPVGDYDSILVYDNTLYCGKDYTSNLQFAAGTTNAACPVCEQMVTWTALTEGTEPFKPTLGGHYYLSDNLTYSGSGAAYLIMNGGTNKTVCVHLNGHNLTSENSRIFYGSSSILNVMGSGTVSGRAPDTYGPGSTVQSNTSNVNGTVNLYAGTYKQASGAASTEYTVNVNDAGKINAYRDAVIQGNVTGKGLRVATPRSGNSGAEIYGAYIQGNVAMIGGDAEKGYATSLLLDDAKIDGTLDINGVNTVTIRHATKIQLLDMESTTALNLEKLTNGTNVQVKNPGGFTEAIAEADTYAKYFKSAWIDDKIVNKDGVLTYKTNYTGKLLLDGNSKGWCPVCMETVSWTALEDNDVLTVAQNGMHYYLASDIQHSGTTTACFKAPETKNHTACLHLNGYNMTAEKIPAIYGSSGVLNVMGNGVVTGYSGSNNLGAGVRLNNYLTAANAVNLYSGTYRKSADSATGSYVIGYGTNGGGVYIYEDALVDAVDGNAIYVGVPHASGDNKLSLYDCTVNGNIYVAAPDASRTTKTVFATQNVTINGMLSIYGSSHDITFTGRTKLSRLSLAAGTVVNFENMLPGSGILVSANGIFTSALEDADNWLQYFSIDEEGDVLLVRDNCLYQGAKAAIPTAEEADITKLDALYADRTIRYGEMHDHTNTGPKADGFYSVAEWKAKMQEIGMDFTTIVDHRQSVHMYDSAWDDSMFIGGSEPSAYIQGWPDGNRNLHYNMIFANASALEEVVQAFEGFEYVAQADGKGGTWVTDVPTFAELQAQADMVRSLGGFFVAVHPKYDSYIKSDDPLDYYYGEYTGIEITTGTGGNMSAKDNEEAYQLWLDLLEMGKKVYATAGSDFHKLPNASALTTLYCDARDAQAYIDLFRSGDFVPGWVGIRMAVGDTTMGGTTQFAEGDRITFSVGDMYNVQINDGYSNSYSYQADHLYSVQLYDDKGLLMESEINPSEMNYFAADVDMDAKYYRIVVWDLTANTRVAVGNPIWNEQ